MRAILSRALLVAAAGSATALFVACGSSTGSPAAPGDDTGDDGGGGQMSTGDATTVHDGSPGGGDTDGQADQMDGSGNSDGATDLDGQTDIDAGDAAALTCPPVVMDGAAPDAGPPVCDPSKTIGTGTALTLATSSNADFRAITPDELTIAWYVQAGGALPYFADRSQTSDAFGAATRLTIDITNSRGMALAPDGLSAVLAAADGQSFVDFTRAARGDAFDEIGDGPFATLNAVTLGANEVYSDPVYSGDGLVFVYSRLDGSGAATMYQSVRSSTSASFPAGTPLDECNLDAVSGAYRRPFALSADARTLVFSDGARGVSRMAWRPGRDWPFTQFADITELAAPNAACTEVYYTATAGGAGSEFFEAPRN